MLSLKILNRIHDLVEQRVPSKTRLPMNRLFSPFESKLEYDIKQWEKEIVVQPNLAGQDSPPIRGFIKVQFEDGTIHRIPLRANHAILSVEFDSQGPNEAPWDYEDPDEDGVFGG